MKYYDVIIATPGKNFTKNYIESILKTTVELEKRNISWIWANAYNAHVGFSRECLMKNNQIGNKIKYNKIFWIDSDIYWKPEDFFKLFYSEKDIICGAYILSPGSTRILYRDYPVSIMKDWVPGLTNTNIYRNTIKDIENFEDITRINETGFGFICIKNKVFDRFDQMNIDYFSSVTTDSFHIFSEDSSWCYKVKEIGFNIYLDKTVLVGHTKDVSLEWNKN